jgi:protein-tyrosine kinase
MEHIKKAIERARQERQNLSGHAHPSAHVAGSNAHAPAEAAAAATNGSATAPPAQVVPIDRNHLQAMRIIAYDAAEGRSTHYDMLRTQVLQRMDTAACKTLAVTSPRLGCGKTVTAINLALSIARQSEQTVLLVDLDLRKPQVARYFGLHPSAGIHDVVSGRCQPSQAMLVPDVCGHRLAVLATPSPVPSPTEHLVSSAMKTALARLKTELGRKIILFDLPPMLSSDDFLAFLPQVDCALLVASSGESTVHDIAECERLMDPEKFLGCVLNKVTEAETAYSYYS